FDRPQKDVRVRQSLKSLVGDEAGCLKRLQALERVSLTELRMLGPIRQLQYLRKELDFSDPSATQLDVAIDAGRLSGSIGCSLVLVNLFERGGIEIGAIDEYFGALQDAPSQ